MQSELEEESDLSCQILHPSRFSKYSADGGQGNYDISGSVKLSIWWKRKYLYVKILRAKNLAKIDKKCPPSPYIETLLMPDHMKLTKRKTQVKANTTSPVYNEVIRYEIKEDISKKILSLRVWHEDAVYGRNLFLGEVFVRLDSLNLASPKENWHVLQERIDERNQPTKGELKFGVRYDPANGGILSIFIYRLNNLIKSAQYTNYFVRALVLPEQTILRTECIDKEEDPEWKTNFEFHNLTLDDVKSNIVLELSLWNHNEKECNEFIGCVRLGPSPEKNKIPWMDSNELETSLWSAMIAHPGQWICTNMELRPTLASCLSNYSKVPAKEEHYINKKCRLSGLSQASEGPGEVVIGDYDITGKLLLKLEHTQKQLIVTISRADNLAPAGFDDSANPYIKIHLFSNDQELDNWSSRVMIGTVNPLFNETIEFPVDESQLSSIMLKISVMHYECYCMDKFLGCLDFDLSTFDLWGTLCWHNLNELANEAISTNDAMPANMSVSLKFVEKFTQTGENDSHLLVFINNIRGAPCEKNGEATYCLVAIQILPGMSADESIMVPLKDGNLVMNHKFKVADVSFQCLFSRLCVELRVVILNKNGRNVIGGLRLGHSQLVGYFHTYIDSNVLENTHWEMMLAHRSEWVVCTHTLRPNMEYSGSSKPAIANYYSADNTIGKLIVSAKFESMDNNFQFKGNLFVKIRAEQLKCKTCGGIFATCNVCPYLECDRWKYSSTEIIKGTANPVWEKVYLIENMYEDELYTKYVLNIKVIDNNGDLKPVYIGRVCLGLSPENSTAEEISHWEAIFRNPGEWVDDIHFLRP